VRALIDGALEGQPSLAAQTIANVIARAEANPLHALDPFTDPAARDPHDPLGRAHALSGAAVFARRRGDAGSAEEAGIEAAEMYRRAGRPLDEARALEYAGHTRAAREAYERCGAVGWAKRLTVADSVAADPAVASSRAAIAALSGRNATSLV
jgi:hypothetical protein